MIYLKCIGGRALAVICQVICEEYGQWQGGVPDLLVWNFATRECRFVEVKSPNDRLQENQKVCTFGIIAYLVLIDLGRFGLMFLSVLRHRWTFAMLLRKAIKGKEQEVLELATE